MALVGASIQVGSLFATSLSIKDADFYAGRYNFYKDGSAGAVTNDGRIEIISVGGYAALAGPQVQNNGVIVGSRQLPFEPEARCRSPSRPSRRHPSRLRVLV